MKRKNSLKPALSSNEDQKNMKPSSEEYTEGNCSFHSYANEKILKNEIPSDSEINDEKRSINSENGQDYCKSLKTEDDKNICLPETSTVFVKSEIATDAKNLNGEAVNEKKLFLEMTCDIACKKENAENTIAQGNHSSIKSEKNIAINNDVCDDNLTDKPVKCAETVFIDSKSLCKKKSLKKIKNSSSEHNISKKKKAKTEINKLAVVKFSPPLQKEYEKEKAANSKCSAKKESYSDSVTEEKSEVKNTSLNEKKKQVISMEKKVVSPAKPPQNIVSFGKADCIIGTKKTMPYSLAIKRNALRYKHQLETGELELAMFRDKQLKMRSCCTEKQKTKEKILKQKEAAEIALKINEVTKEIITTLLEEECDKKVIDLFDKVYYMGVNPLSVLYSPQFVMVIKHCRENECFSLKLRKAANRCYHKCHGMFGIPEGETFWSVYVGDVKKDAIAAEKLSDDMISELLINNYDDSIDSITDDEL